MALRIEIDGDRDSLQVDGDDKFSATSNFTLTADRDNREVDLEDVVIDKKTGSADVPLPESLVPGIYTLSVEDPRSGLRDSGKFRLVSRVVTETASRPPLTVELAPRAARPTGADVLWNEIQAWTDARTFARHQKYVNREVCGSGGEEARRDPFRPGIYNEVVGFTRDFLALRPFAEMPVIDPFGEGTNENGELRLPYLEQILARFPDLASNPDPCFGLDPKFFLEPFPVELIWSYWHEEGGLVQTLNAIVARFQNRRTRPGPDPLARFDLSPLRPLRHFLFEWAEHETDRLTVRRRVAEYEYEYGLRLIGRAVPPAGLAVERRTKFLEAFHTLLHTAHLFFRQEDDTTVNADPYPVLNALRETHLVLAEGAHNQYGDLPTEARVEMLVMEWLLAQPEMRDFLGGKPMVPYEEAWMDRVDAMKSIQGWTDTGITHFRDLGVFGEQLLLSVRLGNWNSEIETDTARGWARRWRPQIQRYTHAYRAATGVDLSPGYEQTRVDATLPALHLARREASRRRGA